MSGSQTKYENDVQNSFSDHFTQLIWKNSKYFGIGKARTRNGKLIIVANYMPAGNVSANFHTNVLPPIFSDIDVNRNKSIKCKLIQKPNTHRHTHPKRLSSASISTISGNHLH